jgi:transposase InsO family protein
LVVIDQFIRRIVGFGVQAMAVNGPALCRMFNHAISGQGLPTRLSTDHDALFRFHRWQANLRVLEVETVRTVPKVPWSHPFIERLIGTLRREYLDRLFFWTADDLEQKLKLSKNYHNAAHVHQGLSGDRPRGQNGSPNTPDSRS